MRGITAFANTMLPKRLVSSRRSILGSSDSSAAPTMMYPALLTAKSILPSASNAPSTTDTISFAFVTSRIETRRRFPYLSLRSSNAEGFRTVATTLSPRSSASSVKVRPKPLLVPVISQLFATSELLFQVDGVSSPAIPFANHAAPCRKALGRMLLHPLGELRRAHQAGLHRDVSEVRGGDGLLAAIRRRGETAEHGDDLDHDRTTPSLRWALAPLTV